MTSLIINPIVTRELRARWRGGRSMVLVFGYVTLLAVTAGIVYASSSISSDTSSVAGDMARVGHNLFLMLSGLQIVAWMLIGPALTATSIAGEREHGLLELLQLTPLSAWRICTGKLGSASLVVILLMFAPLPVTALCFLLGGVSPGEFGVALALQIATVCCGMCLGLWASARGRRATSAMTSTFAVVIGWALLTFLVMVAHESRSPWAYAAPFSSKTDLLYAAPLDFVWRTDPLLVFLYDMVNVSSSSLSSSWMLTYVGVDVPDWILNVAFQIVAALLLWIFAARTLSKPFADAAEDVLSPTRKRRFLRRANSTIEYSNAAAAKGVAPNSLLQRDVLSNRQSDSLWWQWNWLARFRSTNPMLEREVRRRARWRRVARRSQIATRLVALGTALLCLWAMGRLINDPAGRSVDTWSVITIIALLIMLCFSCVQGALAFTREHEGGTWEGIQLSLLSPSQILWGKLLPPFGVALLIGAVLWAPTIFCIEGVLASSSSYSKVTPDLFFGTLVIAASASWVLLCWGLFWSAHLKRVWPAVVWTIGSLLFAYIAVPALLYIVADSSRNYGSTRTINDFLKLWHPVVAMAEMFDTANRMGMNYGEGDTATNMALAFALTVSTFSAVLLLATHRQLQRLIGKKSRPQNTAIPSNEPQA